jgi:hypothetical protein
MLGAPGGWAVPLSAAPLFGAALLGAAGAPAFWLAPDDAPQPAAATPTTAAAPIVIRDLRR